MRDDRVLAITDARVMRALAHPARLAILEHLGSADAGATATECAEVVGQSPSATSYHLRELAKHGLVEAAPSRGDARERMWRRVARGYSVEGARGDALPQSRDAEAALVDAILARSEERVRGWLRRAHDEPEEWDRASWIQETTVHVTSEELAEIGEAISRLVEAYRNRKRPEGARAVAVQWRGVPTD